MPIYSNSRLKKFESCPRAYKFKYLGEVDVEKVQNIYGFLGSRVHETLEFFHENLIDGRKDSLRSLLDHFNEIWNEKWNGGIQIPSDRHEPKHFRKVGEKCVENYYENHEPFYQDSTMDTEFRIYPEIGVEGENYTFMGFIDRLAISSDGKYEIHDYKTSKNLPTEESLRENRQLAIYQIGIQQEYPEADEIDLVWHYLRFGKDFRLSFSQDELDSVKEDAVSLIKRIERAKSEDDFPAKRDQGARCDWCDYWHLCPEWRHYYENESLPLNKFLEEDGKVLVDKLTDLDQELQELEEERNKLLNKRDELEEAIVEHADRKNLNSVFGSEKRASIEREKKFEFPEDEEKRRDLEELLEKFDRLQEASSLDMSLVQEKASRGNWSTDLLERLEKFKAADESVNVNLKKMKDH